MPLFTNADLKSIATQAIGTKTWIQQQQAIDAANDLIDQKVTDAINAATKESVNNITNTGNKSDNLFSNTSQNISSNPVSTQQNIQPGNVLSQLQAPPINSATNVGTSGNVPSIPQLPDVSSAIPGGVSIDPSKYIPDMSSIPFSAFIKPLFNKALSKALNKLNVSSFVQQAQGSLGKLSASSQSNLQGLQKTAQGGLDQSADQQNEDLQNKLKAKGSELGKTAKGLSAEGQVAKTRISNYIQMYFLRITQPQTFNSDARRQDFLLIFNST